ncbi:MAG: 1-deoxy-D-xylulose-5-phosphate synthase N-terminal domain-containing protein [Candidatus Shapirobacteria bacterium]|nr:1-deoxy-D-xylulose-5-phosphate synthase N-terminal domain-containing protein [Candidatus Shapirobacteria bacterium]
MELKLDQNQKKNRRRLLEMIYNSHMSHIGSSLSIIDIIDGIYSIKKRNEKFILSNGHAAAALYIVLEKYKYLKNPNLEKLGVHPDRDPKKGIDVSTGSLGQGLPIAIGMALANKTKNVYCLISDGECAEGSIWEGLRIVHDLKITNLKIIASVNGWGAYDPISSTDLEKRFAGFGFKLIKINGHDPKQIIKALKTNNKNPTIIFAKTISTQLPFLKDLDAHYYTMQESDYQLAQKILK